MSWQHGLMSLALLLLILCGMAVLWEGRAIRRRRRGTFIPYSALPADAIFKPTNKDRL